MVPRPSELQQCGHVYSTHTLRMKSFACQQIMFPPWALSFHAQIPFLPVGTSSRYVSLLHARNLFSYRFACPKTVVEANARLWEYSDYDSYQYCHFHCQPVWYLPHWECDKMPTVLHIYFTIIFCGYDRWFFLLNFHWNIFPILQGPFDNKPLLA